MSLIKSLEEQLFSMHTVEALTKIVKQSLVKRDVDAYEVLQLVERTLDRLFTSTQPITMAETEKHLKELLDRLEASDASHDQAFHDKFAKGPTT